MHWTKYFVNGTTVVEPASWSQTPLIGIEKVTYEDGNFVCGLIGVGYNFWQSDTFIVIMDSGATKPILTTRRISIQLPNEKEVYANIEMPNPNSILFNFNKSLDPTKHKIAFLREENKWFTLEVKPESCQYRYFISEERI